MHDDPFRWHDHQFCEWGEEYASAASYADGEVASTARTSSNQGYHAWVHIANLNGKDGLNLDLGGSTLRMEGATANSSVCGFTATQELGFKCKVTDAGLRLMKNKGLVIIVQ